MPHSAGPGQSGIGVLGRQPFGVFFVVFWAPSWGFRVQVGGLEGPSGVHFGSCRFGRPRGSREGVWKGLGWSRVAGWSRRFGTPKVTSGFFV